MPGFLSSGIGTLAALTGKEILAVDTLNPNGQNPESGSISLLQLAVALNLFTSNLAAGKTTVAGTRYYGTYISGFPALLTGLAVLVGGTGGTDRWTLEMFNAAGLLVASTDPGAGTAPIAGTAATWQQFVFGTVAAPVPVLVPAGTYLLSLQSNGTTAKFAAYNPPTSPGGLLTGSQAGVFATAAPIAPVSVTYTANLAPIITPYV